MDDNHIQALRALSLPDVIRVEPLATFLDMPSEGVLRELESGRMPGRQIEGDWLISRRALINWLGSRPSEVGS